MDVLSVKSKLYIKILIRHINLWKFGKDQMQIFVIFFRHGTGCQTAQKNGLENQKYI